MSEGSRWFWSVVAAVCVAVGSTSSSSVPAADTVTSPLSPDQALKQFQLAPGLRIELAASEPTVIDPVAIRFDESGRMWVVEMRDYPHGPAEGESPKSAIKVLEDRDGDGLFESATVFADKLLFATGVQPWRGGVFVTMAGQVAFLQDTDGDGKADHHETWYTGFAQENSQLRANHPRLALDNHIYVANGLRGGAVVDARNPDSHPLQISGMDFHFDPQTRKFEAVSGVGQFGLTFDDWGNRFVCSNRNPLKHIVIENRYLEKNPLAKVPAVAHDVATSGADSRIYPIAAAWTTSNLHAGQFTAACGVHIYRGDALPSEFYGNAFTCDPTGYLVHREIMEPAGATFVSRPAWNGVEFLASRDEWCRPVNLETGPDGALYVVDMYRAVIEHPQFMPSELKTRPDLLDGSDRGRIYRIVAENAPVRPDQTALSKLNSSQLVDLLGHPNAWQRETAARLLLERQDRSVQQQLETLAVGGDNPVAQVHSLWLLDGLGVLSEETLLKSLTSAHPRVREHTVRLSEPFLKTSDAVRKELARTSDDDARLRFQIALTLAPARNRDDALAALAIAAKTPDDVWLRRAALISIGPFAAEATIAYLEDAANDSLPLLQEMTAQAAATPNPSGHLRLLEAFMHNEGRERACRVGFATLLQRISVKPLLVKLDKISATALDEFFAGCEATAQDSNTPDRERAEAIEALAFSPNHGSVLTQLAMENRSQQVRVAAVAALSRSAESEPWRKMLVRFSSETPILRQAILDAVLARSESTTLLLDEIQAGRVKPSELDRDRTNRLLKHRDADIRSRAQKLFADAIPADRAKVLAGYQVALKMKADPRSGRDVFQKNCATCHRIGDLGVNVAPDISDSRTKQAAQLLTDILQPNRAIDANYIGYSVVSLDGRVLTGILTSETSTSITIRQAEAKESTLLRSEIDQIRSSGQSLMPVGLEKNITHQQMADLLSFIKNWRYLDGRIPLGISR